jgi:hypothetical protein
VIAVAAVIRRVLAIAYSPYSAPPQMAALDEWFASHAALTLSHILPALLFVLVTPFFVFRKSKEIGWPDYALLLLGTVVGITAYAMSFYAVGGRVERSASRPESRGSRPGLLAGDELQPAADRFPARTLPTCSVRRPSQRTDL